MTRRKSLLLVEHDLARRLRVGTAIVRRKWRLRTARSAGEAIETLQWFDAAVIVLDLDLSRTTREDFVAQVREANKTSNVAIIGMIDRDRDAESLGVDVVLTRPFSVDALFEAIDYGYERRAANDEAAPASK